MARYVWSIFATERRAMSVHHSPIHWEITPLTVVTAHDELSLRAAWKAHSRDFPTVRTYAITSKMSATRIARLPKGLRDCLVIVEE